MTVSAIAEADALAKGVGALAKAIGRFVDLSRTDMLWEVSQLRWLR